MNGMCRRSDGLLVREVDEEVLLLDTEFDKIHHFNQTASFVWRRWDDARSPEELAGLLAKEFNVAQHRALDDVRAMLRKLQSLKLIAEEQ